MMLQKNIGSHSERILLIDDNVALTKALGKIVEIKGYKCDIVHDLGSLEDLEDVASISVVVCDLSLVGENGLDAYTWFATRGLSPEFIFISGNFTEIHLDIIDNRLGAHRLEKPFSSADLINYIEKISVSQLDSATLA